MPKLTPDDLQALRREYARHGSLQRAAQEYGLTVYEVGRMVNAPIPRHLQEPADHQTP